VESGIRLLLVLRISSSDVEGTDLQSLVKEVSDVLLAADIRSVGFDEDAIAVVLVALRTLGKL
jgi:hypothetical protein